jgi:hypothetical protein
MHSSSSHYAIQVDPNIQLAQRLLSQVPRALRVNLQPVRSVFPPSLGLIHLFYTFSLHTHIYLLDLQPRFHTSHLELLSAQYYSRRTTKIFGLVEEAKKLKNHVASPARPF